MNMVTSYKELTSNKNFDNAFIGIVQRKGRDLTQSSDKSPYTQRRNQKQPDNTKRRQTLRLHNDCGPTLDNYNILVFPVLFVTFWERLGLFSTICT